MAARPLAGLLLVDLTRHLPGPLASKLLRDLGARAVKVEEPQLGDPARHAPPFVDGESALARILLAGVESVALDLRQEGARRVLRALVGRADVLLESFRPGTLARWGLAPATLRERHPALVVCSLSGWGQQGPRAGRAGHDLTYQAIAGTLASTARVPHLPTADLTGAWAAAATILAALVERGRTGRGRWIDASLLDAAVHANLTSLAAEAGGARGVGEPLPLSGAYPAYDLYRTRDGRLIALAALEPHFWRRLCRAVGRRDLVRRQFRADPESRRLVAALAASRSRAEWEELFGRHDLPGDPVLTVAEARSHPQVAARGLFPPAGGPAPPLYPALLDGERPVSSGPLPALGEHTGRVLDELDLDEARLSPRRRRRLGIGRRPSLKRAFGRLARRLPSHPGR